MSNKILIAGATGYVGGTLINRLVNSTDLTIQTLHLDLLVRTEDAAAKLRAKYGDRITTILWGGLLETDFIETTASNYDLIINVGSGFIAPGALAFVRGLAAHKTAHPTSTPWLLHISGCTNLADKPLTGVAEPDRVWGDSNPRAVYDWCVAREAESPYPQRTTEISVLTLAHDLGVNAVSLNTPIIFGEGEGLFNRQGIIIPSLLRYTLTMGYGFKLNDTANFDWVHVADLADAYILLVKLIRERQDKGVGYIPSGKDGIVFPAVGRVLQTEIFERCLDVCFKHGGLPREGTPKEKEIRLKTLREVADEATGGMLDMAEQGWGGNKAMTGTVLRRLGWEPKFGVEAWERDFEDEWVALKEGRRGYTFDSCLGISEGSNY
ncbi:hypothetical protein QBC34DRAFT_382793 [Podospora aff. communis PSN243]|uniref:NAD-dependent epimerase/dehydratase domain-containing protein n=1 Tax=Podospora aff. communis PSN243 TaxID=3040156 RepID=A0AAV9GHW2_9PEZI|nr:hypothetical protein QBC34DRAFT_382793 [Podospora aff. communis PSN243]